MKLVRQAHGQLRIHQSKFGLGQISVIARTKITGWRGSPPSWNTRTAVPSLIAKRIAPRQVWNFFMKNIAVELDQLCFCGFLYLVQKNLISLKIGNHANNEDTAAESLCGGIFIRYSPTSPAQKSPLPHAKTCPAPKLGHQD